MFRNAKIFSSFSVNDVGKAKEFYGKTLGIPAKEDMGLELQLAGGIHVFLYPKPDHQPATFTVLNFLVEDIDQAVDEMIGKGITFEQYSGQLQTDEKGICRDGSPVIAWFKDPAGNILSVIEEGS